MEKQLKKVTLWTAIPMVIILVIALSLIPASIHSWEIDSGVAPSLMCMIIGIAYVIISFIVAIILNIRYKGEIATRIAKVNGINLAAFFVVFIIIFIIGNAIAEGAA
ncbi:MAG TPA: hypothetical protein G4O10_07825 [Dehalococcoidia bacterium]|nr:hypothetical protein [Dehalococcoidia bacterium]